MIRLLYCFMLICCLLMLLITGCSPQEEVKTVDVSDTETSANNIDTDGKASPDPLPNETKNVAAESNTFMEKPRIVFSSGHSYEGTLWVGDSTEITGTSFQSSGDDIFLEIFFDTEIPFDSIKDKVKLIGYDDYIVDKHYHERNAFRVLARDIEYGKHYTLYIPRSLEDANGNALEEDIEIDITVEEEPEAYYSFIGQETVKKCYGSIYDGSSWPYYFVLLNKNDIEFDVEFSLDVDKVSVETSIRQGLDNEGSINFEWVDNRKLKLSLEGLQTNKEYIISMASATGENNSNIIGNLVFSLLDPTILRSLDLTTGEEKILKEFSDVPYRIVRGDTYEQYFIADDDDKMYCLNIMQGSMYELPELRYAFGYPYYEWYSNWLNSYTVLALDTEIKTIYAHDLNNNQIEPLFSMPADTNAPELYHEYDLKLSPGKDKIAVTSSFDVKDLYIFSLEGDILYEGEAVAEVYIRENSTHSMYLQWLDDNTIVFQDKNDVVKLDITTGTKEILIKDAGEPIALPNSDFIVADISGDPGYDPYLYNIAEGSGFLVDKGVSALMFIDESKLIYNNNEKDIILFDILLKTKEVIGKGRITAVSLDKKRIYYVENSFDIYYF